MASPAYRSDDPDAPLRLVVMGDSTSFTGPRGTLLPDEPALYPNVAGRAISDALDRHVTVSILAHPGAGVRETRYALTKDPHAKFEVMMRADAVVVGIGSFDHAPAGIPPWLEATMPYIQPASLRNRIRAVLRALHPWGVAATGGMIARVPFTEFEHLYDSILFHVRSLSWGAPAVGLGPTSHRSRYYGWVHPQHAARTLMQRQVCERHGIAFVPSWPLVEPFAEKLNEDGIHWPLEAHEAVGEAVAAALIPQLQGVAPLPGIPGFTDRDAPDGS